MPSEDDFFQPLDHQFRKSFSRRIVDAGEYTPIDRRQDEGYSYIARRPHKLTAGEKPERAIPKIRSVKEETDQVD